MTRNAQRYRRACDYLAASMICLRDNFLLAEPLRPEHLKPRLLGHWGHSAGTSLRSAKLSALDSVP
jgi:xylulose-5-phosphate/fructose-6-phosphate phosphoketolase